MRLGCHVSVSAGYPAAVSYASQIGAQCIQIFAKSPRQWRARPLDEEKATGFSELRETAGITPLFTHTAYLINLTTTDENLRHKSIDALADELERGRMLQAAGVVTHMGNDPGDDRESAARRGADSIARALELCGPLGGTRLLLENTAGAGSTFGSTPTEIGATIAALPSQLRTSVGMCLDTCHAHAFGLDLTGSTGWQTVLDDIDREIGLSALGLIHANDCSFERGSRKDRHAWLGTGYIGDTGFSAMVNAPQLADIAVVTEMPGDVPDKDVVNLEYLKGLMESELSAQ